MPSAEDLRQEVRRLLRETEGFIDPKVKQELAARALELAQRAERIDVLVADPRRLEAEIARRRSMLMRTGLDPAQRRVVREALADAEALLAGLPHAPGNGRATTDRQTPVRNPQGLDGRQPLPDQDARQADTT